MYASAVVKKKNQNCRFQKTRQILVNFLKSSESTNQKSPTLKKYSSKRPNYDLTSFCKIVHQH